MELVVTRIQSLTGNLDPKNIVHQETPMTTIEVLAAEYEKSVGLVVHVALPPTSESVVYIEQALGFKLPKSMRRFADLSAHYGNWLAGLGIDYDTPTHIVQVNRRLQNEGKIPQNFVAINVGYDGDYSCIDIETYDAITDEYLITYWASDVQLSECALSADFLCYLQENLAFWRSSAPESPGIKAPSPPHPPSAP